MTKLENDKFTIAIQSDNRTLVVRDRNFYGEVRIYVDKDDIDSLIELLQSAKTINKNWTLLN